MVCFERWNFKKFGLVGTFKLSLYCWYFMVFRRSVHVMQVVKIICIDLLKYFLLYMSFTTNSSIPIHFDFHICTRNIQIQTQQIILKRTPFLFFSNYALNVGASYYHAILPYLVSCFMLSSFATQGLTFTICTTEIWVFSFSSVHLSYFL